MKIEEGKFYKTRDGRKAGPMLSRPEIDFPWAGQINGGTMLIWGEDGIFEPNIPMNNLDLVSEWGREPTAPKTWGEMTGAEKGALLLAEYEGKQIQFLVPRDQDG